MATKALYRKVSIYINGKEIESTIGSLLGCMERLKEQQKAMTIGSEEYIETSLKIKEIKSVLEDQRRAIQSAAKDWDAVREKAAQYGGVIAGFRNMMSMLGTSLGGLQDLAADAAALDDVYADVQKTTGLTHEEVEKLNEAFKKMDTRTSREQLNQLAYDAAKLDKKTNQQSFSTTFYKYLDKKNDFF